MTTYTWSTLTQAQAITFTGGDQVVFDNGTSTAANATVQFGAATSSITYAGKSVLFQNTYLTGDVNAAGDPVQFLFLDGSVLGVNATAAEEATGVAGNGNDVYYGGTDTNTAGVDTVDGGAGNDSMILGNGNDTATGNTGNDSINGNQGDDGDLRGAAGNDSVFGGQGNDIIGVAADDTGNDSMNGNIGNDQVAGGSGNDSVFGGQNSDTLTGGAGDDSLSGDLGDDNIDGGAGNDSIFGLDGNDTIAGGSENDSVNGNLGSDVLDGGTGTDSVYGGQGDDTITNAGGNDSISANIGNDSVLGGAGAESIFGGQGNDTIDANGGADSISGDLGNDTIQFDAGDSGTDTTAGIDQVAGFTTGADKIDLVVNAASYTEVGVYTSLTAAVAGAGGVAAGAVELVQVNNSNGTSDVYILWNSAGADTTVDDMIKLTGITLDQIASTDII